jgi:hypothetical protein
MKRSNDCTEGDNDVGKKDKVKEKYKDIEERMSRMVEIKRQRSSEEPQEIGSDAIPSVMHLPWQTQLEHGMNNTLALGPNSSTNGMLGGHISCDEGRHTHALNWQAYAHPEERVIRLPPSLNGRSPAEVIHMKRCENGSEGSRRDAQSEKCVKSNR